MELVRESLAIPIYGLGVGEKIDGQLIISYYFNGFFLILVPS